MLKKYYRNSRKSVNQYNISQSLKQVLKVKALSLKRHVLWHKLGREIVWFSINTFVLPETRCVVVQKVEWRDAHLLSLIHI